MSSSAYQVQAVAAAPPLQPSEQDDVEVMLEVFAAFGSLYEAAAKADASNSGKPLLQ